VSEASLERLAERNFIPFEVPHVEVTEAPRMAHRLTPNISALGPEFRMAYVGVAYVSV